MEMFIYLNETFVTANYVKLIQIAIHCHDSLGVKLLLQSTLGNRNASAVQLKNIGNKNA